MKRVSDQHFRLAVEKAYTEWQEVRFKFLKLGGSRALAAVKCKPVTDGSMEASLESRDEELRWSLLGMIGGLLDQFDGQSNRRARQRMNFLLGKGPKRTGQKVSAKMRV